MPRFSFALRLTSLFCLTWISGAGCSTAARVKPGVSAETLFNAACRPGQGVTGVQGHIWVKIKSKQFSGQFPADVKVAIPGQLQLEITNILGGTEALLSIQNDHYQILSGGTRNQELKEEGYGEWAGIPLVWAIDLFLGKVPCPTSERYKNIHLVAPVTSLLANQAGDLSVNAIEISTQTAETFTYRFQEYQGKPWPDFLLWEKLGTSPLSIEFVFDGPEADTMSPKKWEAQSKTGSIKVRWSNREVTPGLSGH